MNKIIYTLMLILGLSIHCFGQNEIQDKYRQLKSDTIKEYYTDNSTLKTLIVKEESVILFYSTFYKNGQINERYRFDEEGRYSGDQIIYNKHGDTLYYHVYKNGEIQSSKCFYYKYISDSEKILTGNAYWTRDDPGMGIEQVEKRENELPGPIAWSNGYCFLYYDNGTLESKGRHVLGKKKGVWRFYDKEGKYIKEKDYD
jgi:antitoxin component YwqK of YwqJK toxin-antitoxin module